MHNPAMPVVKSHVFLLRNVRGLSQQQLADQASISRQTLHKIEAEKMIPSVFIALRLAQALDSKVENLFQIQYVLPKDKQYKAAYPFRSALRHMPKLYSKHKRTDDDLD